MLPRLRILQIGDVHLPGAARSPRPLDTKDKRFPTALRDVLAVPPTKRVFKAIYKILETERISALLFMGDLTDIGKLPGYNACAKYIRNAFQLGSGERHETLLTGIVPGNHDIDRNLAKLPGAATKFEPLQQALRDAGLKPLPISRPIWIDARDGVAAAKIGLLNSCWGCGEREYIPAEFRDGVFAAIEAAIASGSDESVVRAYYERQFDTPAFSDDTITEVASVGAAGNELLVITAHHNILPQRLTRLAPYTELVNSGAIRGTLMDLGRPVLYLHGHIHEDPVEVLQSPGGEPLVCISAPELNCGFNILELIFTKVGIPLSVRIIAWRFNKSGILRPSKPVLIPLIGSRLRAHNRYLSEIYALLLKSSNMFWSDLLTASHSVFTEDVEAQLEEAIETLFADGRVRIENYDLSKSSWIIGASL